MSDQIVLEASSEIISIASKYIIASVLLVAIGAIGLVYSLLTYFVYGSAALPFAIFLGFFIGIGFIAIGIFLNFWGLYWMRTEGRRLKKRFHNFSQKSQ